MLIPKRTQQNPQNLERTAHRPKLTPNGLESARNHHQPMFKNKLNNNNNNNITMIARL